MREPPQDGQQAVEDRTRLFDRADPAPRLRGGERGLHLIRTAVRDDVVLLFVALGESLALSEVEHDAGRGAPQLI